MADLVNNDNWLEYMTKWEGGYLCCEEEAAYFQFLINGGHAWRLLGLYGKRAMDMIEWGKCTWGEEPQTGYFGQIFPSKNQIKPMDPGSDEFVAKRLELGEDAFSDFLEEKFWGKEEKEEE